MKSITVVPLLSVLMLVGLLFGQVVSGEVPAPGNMGLEKEDNEDGSLLNKSPVGSLLWGSTITLSPTPFISTFAKIEGAYQVEKINENESGHMPNIAINTSCVVSSSPKQTGTFCRLSDEDNYTIATASEQDPFVMIDLEKLYFADHLSFGVNTDQSSVEEKLSVMCLNASEPDLMNTDSSAFRPLWSKTVLQNSESYSFHVHSPCQVVRFQRHSFGQLAISDLKIFGIEITNNEVIDCLSGHGSMVCEDRGVCVEGVCDCNFGFSGKFCDDPVFYDWLSYGIQMCITLSIFLILSIYYRRTTSTQYKYVPQEEGGGEVLRSIDTSKLSKQSTAWTSAPSYANVFDHNSRSCDHFINQKGPDALHLLFSSPLVAEMDGALRPIQELDIRREYEMLRQSLNQAAGPDRNPIPVTVSTATVDTFHALMTVGDARCLHFAGHSTTNFLAFEDSSGQLHQIKSETLRRLLRSTVTSKLLETLRLVVLNACSSSEQLAVEFIMAGIPHVIAYRGKVRDSTAAIFTQALYLALACGRSIRDSFDSAREALYASPSFCESERHCFVLLPERGDHTEVLWSNDSQYQLVPKWPLPGDVPPRAEEFIGRHLEVWRIMTALTKQKRRMIVVHGPEGIGRTQLVVAVAQHAHLRKSVLSFQQVYFVDAEPMSDFSSELAHAAALLDQIFYSVCNQHASLTDGMEERLMKRDMAHKIRVLAKTLGTKHCLLVIDNVEESASVVSLILNVLLQKATRLNILLTSRTAFQLPLDVNVQHFALAPLTMTDAALVFVRHLKRKILIEGNEPSIVELSNHSVITDTMGKPSLVIRKARELSGQLGNDPIELSEL